MRRPIDSLFGRLVVLVIGVLVLSHLAWFAVIRVERDYSQTRYAVEEAAFLVEAVRQHIANNPEQPLPRACASCRCKRRMRRSPRAATSFRVRSRVSSRT